MNASVLHIRICFPTRAHLVDHVIWQVLVQVREAVGVLGEGVVLAAEPIASGHLAETHQVDHIERRDVVGQLAEMGRPVARLPEAETLHLGAGVAEGRVAVRGSFEVKVRQLLQVRTHHLHAGEGNTKTNAYLSSESFLMFTHAPFELRQSFVSNERQRDTWIGQ